MFAGLRILGHHRHGARRRRQLRRELCQRRGRRHPRQPPSGVRGRLQSRPRTKARTDELIFQPAQALLDSPWVQSLWDCWSTGLRNLGGEAADIRLLCGDSLRCQAQHSARGLKYEAYNLKVHL